MAHVEARLGKSPKSAEVIEEPRIDLEPTDEVIQRTLKEIVFTPPS
jgi:hypothetical protein